ncbi:unnamed protein product [Didymodactylos carnosus]|uniref:Uncharacterized protein n=1 Tax=Didymodactylos carnosus TaxID=1234261 RepID=A0A813RNF2_9BILA|nr:unnamed protein product [Didymodactylos carnosus]CAF0786845.1 unnamed protein product [Didymodactylos carnosus]CAF3562629.1 unnamed protein product [Didymodactylos carnosus]CAF3570741.1 unnamed protein product [Didymodactylos carnosus]
MLEANVNDVQSKSIKSTLTYQKMCILFNKLPRNRIEQDSIFSSIYTRQYSTFGTSNTINETSYRRMLKTSQYQYKKQMSTPTRLTCGSTYFLGNYVITTVPYLQLYAISTKITDKNRCLSSPSTNNISNSLVFIGKDEQCRCKLELSARVEYCDIDQTSSKSNLVRDGFILVTKDAKLLLYSLNLEKRSNNIIHLKCSPYTFTFRDNAFIHCDEKHLLIFHCLIKQVTNTERHLFYVLKTYPMWLSYAFVITNNIFNDPVLGKITNVSLTTEFLIVQYKRKICQLYSLNEILDKFTLKSSCIGRPYTDSPLSIVGSEKYGLPLNVEITSKPTMFYQYYSDRTEFEYCHSYHFLTLFVVNKTFVNDCYCLYKIDKDCTIPTNGLLKRSLSDNMCCFLDTIEDDIIDIREWNIIVWRIKETEQGYGVYKLYTIDDETTLQQTSQPTITRFGRTIKHRENEYNQLNENQPLIRSYTFDTIADILCVVFEYDTTIALIKLIEHPTGKCLQTIKYQKQLSTNSLVISMYHDLLAIQEKTTKHIYLNVFTIYEITSKYEEQLQEFEALSCIYPEKIEVIYENPYPRLKLYIKLTHDTNGNSHKYGEVVEVDESLFQNLIDLDLEDETSISGNATNLSD